MSGLQATMDLHGAATTEGDRAEIEGLMAEAMAMGGEPVRAIPLYRRCIAAAKATFSADDIAAQRSVELGHLLLDSDDAVLRAVGTDRKRAIMEADGLFRYSLDFGTEVGALREQMLAERGLGRVAETQGRTAEALAHYKSYLVLRDSVLTADKVQAVSNLQIRYETEKKEQQIVLLGKDKEVQAKEIQKQKLMRNSFIGGFLVVFVFAVVFLAQRRRIKKEHARSESLLLNILPAVVAEELKANGEAQAVHFDQVTVLFTDFKGFTAMSEVVTPAQLVKDLNECFSVFDRITEKYGIEKIKTIGDAYMAAGGLPTPNTTHALDVVKAALEIRDFIAEGKARKAAAGLPYFEIRIGIHSGPVVAGIVGVKKFAYDIWGDTVNTASRMESSGEVGQVNISEATYELVKETVVRSQLSGSPTTDNQQLTTPAFKFTPRGKVQAKGKGEMEMYFVTRV